MARLTLQECDVARLTAAGRSDAAIARELRISVRTVENLLYAVYAKCGIVSSDELPAVSECWTGSGEPAGA